MIVGIYKITSPTGKIYIGQSINFIKRLNNYKNLQCKEQKRIYNSLKKYGFDAHYFEIIHELPKDVKQEILDQYETLYWKQYKDLGFKMLNLKEPGKGIGKLSKITKNRIGRGNKGKLKLKPEGFGEKVSKRLKGNKYGCVKNKHSKEFLENLNKRLKGNKYLLGHNMTKESKIKMSKSKDSVKKRIYCPELNINFDSISDAARKLNIKIMDISYIINGYSKSGKTRKGLSFKLINDV